MWIRKGPLCGIAYCLRIITQNRQIIENKEFVRLMLFPVFAMYVSVLIAWNIIITLTGVESCLSCSFLLGVWRCLSDVNR